MSKNLLTYLPWYYDEVEEIPHQDVVVCNICGEDHLYYGDPPQIPPNVPIEFAVKDVTVQILRNSRTGKESVGWIR